MENEELQQSQEQPMEQPQEQPIEQPVESKPRPRWQRILAWVALAVFVAFLFMYYVNILRSGA